MLRKASAFQLVFMMYSVICSGAYGLEQMISGSGPGMAILTLCLLPLIWAVPLSLACAELSARFPVEGGYYRWARMAFGDFVGYQAGWLVWLGNLATNGTFAVLFASYLRYFVPGLSTAGHLVVALLLVWLATWLNYRGIRLVGTTSVVVTILIFLPFLVMTVVGLLEWRFNPLAPFVRPGLSPIAAFAGGLPIAIWLYSGYEKLTTNAEEVEAPSRAFPIALAIAVPMTIGSYIVPTVAGLAARGDWQSWGESYFSVIAEKIGGTPLGAGMAVGALLSNFGLLMVTILGQSRLPMVLAQDGMFPRAFQRTHPRFGTPVLSLVVNGVVLSLLCRFDFAVLAAFFTLVQVFAYLLIYAALFRLREAPPLPATHGAPAGTSGAAPFRIPLGRVGLALMTAPSVVLSFLVVLQSIRPAGVFDTRQALIDVLILASGPFTYWLWRVVGPRGAAPAGR